MFLTTAWNVLLVDDEMDVLTLSKLALQNVEVFGLPLALYTVKSKAEAIDCLNDSLDSNIQFSIAFIDVVMETDDAGLGLCEYIREEFGDRLMQLFIRTGQPGIAPERGVIDKHEINGYFTKMEATEEKLYSLVKSGVRQFLWTQVAQMYISGLSEVLRAQNRQEQIQRLMVSLAEDHSGAPSAGPFYVAFGDQVIVQQGATNQQINEWQNQLALNHGIRLSLGGNIYARLHEGLWSIRIIPTDRNASVWLICQTAFNPPDDLVAMTHDFLQGLAALWQDDS